MNHQTDKEKCEHKEALLRSGIEYPEGYICRVCTPTPTQFNELRDEYLKWEAEYFHRFSGYPTQSIIADWWLSRIHTIQSKAYQELREKIEGMKKYPSVGMTDEEVEMIDSYCIPYNQALDEVLQALQDIEKEL